MPLLTKLFVLTMAVLRGAKHLSVQCYTLKSYGNQNVVLAHLCHWQRQSWVVNMQTHIHLSLHGANTPSKERWLRQSKASHRHSLTPIITSHAFP